MKRFTACAFALFACIGSASAANEPTPDLVKSPKTLSVYLNEGYELKSGDISVGGMLHLQKGQKIVLCHLKPTNAGMFTDYCYESTN